jgi:hypothetical protein
MGSRLQELCEQTAGDITKCSNACDAYHQKHLISRCFLGSAWEQQFKEYVSLFSDRKQEFVLAMTVRVTMGTEDIKKEVKEVKAYQMETNERFVASSFASRLPSLLTFMGNV